MTLAESWRDLAWPFGESTNTRGLPSLGDATSSRSMAVAPFDFYRLLFPFRFLGALIALIGVAPLLGEPLLGKYWLECEFSFH